MNSFPARPRLAARQLQIQYGPDAPFTLTQLTLEVCPGEMIGVIGPNGSGKSTLIRALSRALRPAGGVALLDDRDLYHAVSARDAAQAIAVLPQETAISLDFTVREVVRMGRAPHLPRRPFAGETAEDEQIITQALETAGVAALAERGVTTLSGGERQRVLLARALAQQTDVILLDEPTAHLDLRHQTETLTLARDLAHEKGKAVLAVLHDINLASAYCDQLVLLDAGRIAAQGTPNEVLTAENIQAVYGARVWVRRHPVSGRPLILSLPELIPGRSDEMALLHVHMICGGGTGVSLMLTMHRQKYVVTLGGLNEGDIDAEAADMLGIPYAREAAFSRLSPDAQAEAERLAASSSVVLLTDVPFGWANLPNLHAALKLCLEGKPVVCLGSPHCGLEERDFTDGEATTVWNQLLAAGMIVIPNREAALSLLERAIHGSSE